MADKLQPELITEHVRRRFEAKLGEPDENGCREWLGGCDDDGYGVFYIGHWPFRASRVAIVMSMGQAMADGHVARHTCDNSSCGEPTHLISGTQADNIRDRDERGHTHRTTRCPCGNVYDGMTPKGRKYCKLCARRRRLTNYYRAKEAC